MIVRPLAPLALLVLSSAACLPDPQPIRFEPLDRDQLDEDLANPTADVDEVTRKEVADQLAADKAAIAAMFEFLGSVLLREIGQGGEPTLQTSRALEGTNVFAKVACPGPDEANPDTSFEFGALRIDSPTFTDEFVDEFDLHGDLWLDHDDCVVGDFEYFGGFASYYDTQDIEVGLDVNLEFIDHAIDEFPRDIHYPIRGEPGVAYQALITLESGKTLVAEFVVGNVPFGIRGANGVFTCELDLDALDLVCMDPP